MASRRWWGLTVKVFGKLGEQFDKSSQDPVAAWLGFLSQSGQEDLPGRLDFSVSELRVRTGVGHAGAASTGPRCGHAFFTAIRLCKHYT